MMYVVTAVHNRYKITEAFIDALLAQTYQNIKLVLVDDGCTDGTAAMVKNKMPDSIILQGDGNLWWGGALHMAYCWLIENAQDDEFIMFANDDTHFEANYLETAVELLSANPQFLITGCGYNCFTNEMIDGAIHWNFKTGKAEGKLQPNDEGNCASTRSLFFTAKTMKEVGGFHPHRLPHYASDYEWTIRAAKKGHKILSFDTLCYMFDPGTTGDNSLNELTLKKLFSIRSNANPIYKINFIFMSTSLRDLPSHFAYQMGRYVKKIGLFMRIIGRKEKK